MFRMGRRWACPSIALAIGFLAGPGRAEAAFTTGIMVDQTILMPVGDPQFGYDFRSSLVAMNALSAGDYIEFDKIPDYASASFTSSLYGNNLFTVTATATSGIFTNVRFTYTPPAVLSNPGTDNIFLGDFIVATTDNYDPNNIPPQLLMSFPYYTQTTSTIPPYPKNTGMGFTPFPTLAVPEPPSAALIAIGLPAAVALLRRARWRSA